MSKKIFSKEITIESLTKSPIKIEGNKFTFDWKDLEEKTLYKFNFMGEEYALGIVDRKIHFYGPW